MSGWDDPTPGPASGGGNGWHDSANGNGETWKAGQGSEFKDMTSGFESKLNLDEVAHDSGVDTTERKPFTCHTCNEEGHIAKECPNKPALVCLNCGQEGHKRAECTEGRKLDLSDIPDMSVEEAMKQLEIASTDRDTDLFKRGVKILLKADSSLTYGAIEQKIRDANLDLYLIALDRETPKTFTNVDLQGQQGRKYTVGYFFSAKPRRLRMRDEYPSDSEQNLKRLEDAGDSMPSLVPICMRCKESGHISKNCEQPPVVRENKQQCGVCGGEGHYSRDCKEVRVDKSACRNCGQSGHRAVDCSELPNVECHKCGEKGHKSRECPKNEGDSRACRNCGEDGHIAKDCEKPRDPSTMTCRNCDEVGHMSRECPKPRDYSRVKCNTCGEMGHTSVRCKSAPADDGFGGGGGGFDDDAAAGSKGGFDAAPVASTGGGWDKEAPNDDW